MPTSVLLAVLAAAGLLALAPALVRRYDATERLVAERAQSTARVLQRRRRRRTVPGGRPINPPRFSVVTFRDGVPVASSIGGAGESPAVSHASVSPSPAPAGTKARRRRGLRLVPPRAVRRRPPPPRRHTTAVQRRRRVFAALMLLNCIELLGVALVGPGFWISVSVTGALLVAYVVHLRNRSIASRRRRKTEAREAAWLAARQAEVRREQARRAHERREAQRRLTGQREAIRRTAMGLDRVPDPELPAVADGTGGGPPRPRGASLSYRPAAGLRGRAYQAGGNHQRPPSA